MKPFRLRAAACASFFFLSMVPLSALSSLSALPGPIFAAVANSDGTDAAQQPSGFGPLDPKPPAGITPQQIIEKFAARESDFAKARDNYTFRQTVKVNTINDDTSKIDGEYQQVTDITFNKAGRREEHVVFAPQNTLERVLMTPADFDEIEHRLPFILTTEDLPHYDITYLGRQHIDEIDTYVFSAGPKVLEKGKRYFQGKVWVDQQDFQIVLVNGITVPQDKRKGHEDLSPPFTTYYEQVDGKYWFPTYTRAEGNLHFQAQDGALSEDIHMRNTVKYTDYKQYHATSRIIYNGQDITDNKAPEDKKQQPQPTAPAK